MVEEKQKLYLNYFTMLYNMQGEKGWRETKVVFKWHWSDTVCTSCSGWRETKVVFKSFIGGYTFYNCRLKRNKSCI